MAELNRQQLIERSLIKKFRSKIWCRFIGALKDYHMISPGDRIAVCISGGKDSMLLAKCMQQLERHSEIPFETRFIVMDPGYNAENRAKIEENAEILGIPLHIFNARIFDYVYKQAGSPCYLCARMRRGYLYREAQLLGCNKIALGHHFDDVVETVLMSMIYGAQIKTMMPKLRSTNFAGMELIRPLYLVEEADIIAWARYNSLEFIRCACRITEKNAQDEDGSKRQEIKQLVAHIKKSNPQAAQNIFHSVHNVNLATIVAYRHSDGQPVVDFNTLYENCQMCDDE